MDSTEARPHNRSCQRGLHLRKGILMDKIKDLDAVAYVRFASVYREFKDVNTFMNELKKMLDK